MSTVGQVVGLLLVLAGIYLLAGLAWALLVAGVAVLGVATLHEYTTPRAGRKDGS